MRHDRESGMSLCPVDEDVLARLVEVATTDAEADEVTPRLGDDVDAGWTPERVEWLRAFHRAARAGLDGPAGDATWAVLVDGDVAGQVRLRRADERGLVETGLWIARSARGRGVGRAAIALVVAEARAHAAGSSGVAGVRADTTEANLGSLAILLRF